MLANGYTVKISILYVKSSCTGLQDIRIPMLSLQWAFCTNSLPYSLNDHFLCSTPFIPAYSYNIKMTELEMAWEVYHGKHTPEVEGLPYYNQSHAPLGLFQTQNWQHHQTDIRYWMTAQRLDACIISYKVAPIKYVIMYVVTITSRVHVLPDGHSLHWSSETSSLHTSLDSEDARSSHTCISFGQWTP